MASRRGSHREEGKENVRCGKCKRVVGDIDKGIQCEICETWYHAAREGVSDEVYRVLSNKSYELHWFCKGCCEGALKTLKAVGRLQDRIDKMEEEMMNMRSDTDKEIKELKHAVGNIDS